MTILIPDGGTAPAQYSENDSLAAINHWNPSFGGYDLRAIFYLFQRRFRLIAITFSFVFVFPLAIALTITPSYIAASLVLVEPSRTSLLDPGTRAAMSADGAKVDSEAEIIRSDAILMQVARAQDLISDPEFATDPSLLDRIGTLFGASLVRHPAEAFGRVLENFRDNVSIQRRGLTHLISIGVASQDPDKAATLANAIAQTYIAHQIATKVDGRRGEHAAIEREIQRARETVIDAERALGTYTNNVVSQFAGPDSGTDPDSIRASLPADIQTELYGLRQIATNAATQFQALLARRQLLDTEASLQVAESRIVSEAIAPPKPTFPDMKLTAALALLLATGMAVGLAVLLDSYAGGFTRAAQVTAATGRLLATVLPEQALEPGASSVADILVEAPFSPYAESMRRLRAVLDTTLHRSTSGARETGTPGDVIMVASAVQDEGKTTAALALARTYALTGQRVIILDCNLRRPRMHQQLAVAGTVGLADILGGKVEDSDLSRILVSDPRSPVTSIVGGSQAALPTDQLFATRSFGQIIASARASFDCVIIDAPPIEPIVDGLYLARHADAVVLVVHWAKTPQQAVVNAIGRVASMMDKSAEILIALNRHEGRSANGI